MAQPALAARARDRGGRHGDPCRCAALALRHHTAARPHHGHRRPRPRARAAARASYGLARASHADRRRARVRQRPHRAPQRALADRRRAGRRRFGIAEARQGHGGRGQDGHSQRADPSARGARRPARDSGGDRRFGGNPPARGPARPRRRRAKAIDRKGLAGKSSERQPAEGAVGDADGIGLHSAGRQSKDMMPRTLSAVNLALAAVAALLVLYIGRQFVAPTSLPVGGRRAAAPTASAAAIETARSPARAYNMVASRNLFSPTRTEAPSSGVLAAAPVVRPNLFGVVVRDSGSIAYLEDPTTKRVAGYRVGDRILGGTVQSIKVDAVTIDAPGGAMDVRLHDPGKPRATPAAAAGTPQPGMAPVLPGVIPPVTPMPPTPMPPQAMQPPVQHPGQPPALVPGQPPLVVPGPPA